jgi:hypothetical protein
MIRVHHEGAMPLLSAIISAIFAVLGLLASFLRRK